MKNRLKSKLSLLILFLYSGLGAVIYAQETRVVTLYVDTEAINTNIPDPELGTVCNFGQEEGITNEEYLTEVNQGDIVQWRGVALNDSDVVNIEQILYVRGPNPFPNGVRELPGAGENAKTVNVQATTRTGNESCKYMVKYTVVRNGTNLNRVFNIDPQLRVK